MSGVGDLLIGLSALVGALASAFVLVFNTVRPSRQPKQVAKSAAEESAAAVVEALADGDLSREDVETIQQALHKQHDEHQTGGDPP